MSYLSRNFPVVRFCCWFFFRLWYIYSRCDILRRSVAILHSGSKSNQTLLSVESIVQDIDFSLAHNSYTHTNIIINTYESCCLICSSNLLLMAKPVLVYVCVCPHMYMFVVCVCVRLWDRSKVAWTVLDIWHENDCISLYKSLPWFAEKEAIMEWRRTSLTCRTSSRWMDRAEWRVWHGLLPCLSMCSPQQPKPVKGGMNEKVFNQIGQVLD